MTAGSQLVCLFFFIFIQSRTLARGIMLPTFRVDPPSQLTSLKIP